MAKKEKLIASGFCFLAQISNRKTLMENKFTGLRVIYNSRNDTYEVVI